jgi:hypothetical protein
VALHATYLVALKMGSLRRLAFGSALACCTWLVALTDPVAAQSGPDMAPTPFAVAQFTVSDDHVAFEIVKPRARSNSVGMLSHIAIQGLDATVYVKHVTVQVGSRSTDIPVRRVLGPGDGTGAIDLRTNGAIVRNLIIHIQANTQSPGRMALFVPHGSAAAAAIVSTASPGHDVVTGSLAADMTPIGRYIAMPGVERHTLRLGTSKGRFTSLALRIREGAIGLDALRVVYNTGEVQTVPVGRPFGTGDRTPDIVLERDTFISEMQFALAPLLAGRAVIDVHGTYADGWTGDAGESKTYTAGWVMLGLRRATRDHLARDSGVPDDTRIAPGLGRFKKLRFTARDGAMTLGVVTVLFDDGERLVLPVGQTLERDQTSQPVSIEDPGRARGIAAITLPPASRIAAKRDGYVEIWGQN